MTEDISSTEDVKFLPPDRSLHKKLGNIDLDLLLPQKVVVEAQKVIDNSTDTFLTECLAEAVQLESLVLHMQGTVQISTVLSEVIRLSFSVKTKAGIGGYDLVATIARSLQLFSEKIQADNLPLSDVNRHILEWHVESLKRLFDLKVKGMGGPIGEAILKELKKMGTLGD